MAKSFISYFLLMLWFAWLLVTSILLFTRGFLLTRVTQTNNATCQAYSASAESCFLPNNNSHNAPNTDNCGSSSSSSADNAEVVRYAMRNVQRASRICLPPKTRKVVLLIIDALRYDFTLFDADLEHEPLPYQNKLPVIKRLLDAEPQSTRLYQFIADPPTTTMQRLKGLTTGSLPTFIDAGSNFATAEINEDNLIDQLIRNNGSAVFMGDDTWTGLYPDRFMRSYPFPSFHVWDLDTVDAGVVAHLFPELERNDWNLLIGHFLGVDHCGHRYGPNHVEMARKLDEMNTVIEKVVDEIDENTMLFVIGDHGMTVTGDHGGESADEITSALFIYSKQPLTTTTTQEKQQHVKVKQVDLVPTLSILLGIPIPFSNLGTLILDALPAITSPWQLLFIGVWSNVQQMMTYIDRYAATTADNTFDTNVLNRFHERFSILTSKIDENLIDNIDLILRESNDLMIDLRLMCEHVWIQFDSFSITRGLLLLFLSMFFIFLITDGIPTNRLETIFLHTSSNRFIYSIYSGVIIVSISVILAIIFYYFRIVDSFVATLFFSVGIASQLILISLVVKNWDLITFNWYDRSKTSGNKIQNLICRLVMVFMLCGLFTNSFILEESFTLLFLLNTIILIGTFSLFNYNNNDTSTAKKRKFDFKRPKRRLLLMATLMLFLVKLSTYFWRCRIEQQWCFIDINNTTKIPQLLIETIKLNGGQNVQTTLTIIALATFVTITKIWLRNCGNLNGYSLTVSLTKYVPTVLVILISGFWVIRNENQIAWTIYGLILISIAWLVYNPLSVYILSTKKKDSPTSSTHSHGDDNVIPHLFRHMKSLFDGGNNDSSSDPAIPIVCGLGTVYSAAFIMIGIYLTLLFALLLGNVIAPSAVIMFLTAAFVLIITSIMRIERAKSIDQLFAIPNMSILVWTIMSQYFFYASGHQPTFPNIAWDAAFVGLNGIATPNFLPGILIILNTFCSYILMGFLLPLILIAPFTILIMMPSAVTRKNAILHVKENFRGELFLYENDGLMMTTAFTMSCKYLMCHGLRVFATMLAATIHCRHLMIWNIFAPKFIFESIGFFATLVSVLLGYLLLVRINSQVNRLVIGINKQFSS